MHVNGYHNLTQIGRGGSANVFSATSNTGESVALKIFEGAWSGDEVKAFECEREVLDLLKNVDGVVTLIDTGTTENGSPYLVMPLYVRGTVRDQLIGSGPFREDKAIKLVLNVGETLINAHALGVYHRDLKPANLLIGNDKKIMLSDFGVSQIVDGRSLTTMNGFTPGFCAPECFIGQPVNGATVDVYGLGATLWSLLSGISPFSDSGNDSLIMWRRITEEPITRPRLGISHGVIAVINQAMAKNPEDRYATITELVEETNRALIDTTIFTTNTPDRPYQGPIPEEIKAANKPTTRLKTALQTIKPTNKDTSNNNPNTSNNPNTPNNDNISNEPGPGDKAANNGEPKPSTPRGHNNTPLADLSPKMPHPKPVAQTRSNAFTDNAAKIPSPNRNVDNDDTVNRGQPKTNKLFNPYDNKTSSLNKTRNDKTNIYNETDPGNNTASDKTNIYNEADPGNNTASDKTNIYDEAELGDNVGSDKTNSSRISRLGKAGVSTKTSVFPKIRKNDDTVNRGGQVASGTANTENLKNPKGPLKNPTEIDGMLSSGFGRRLVVGALLVVGLLGVAGFGSWRFVVVEGSLTEIDLGLPAFGVEQYVGMDETEAAALAKDSQGAWTLVTEQTRKDGTTAGEIVSQTPAKDTPLPFGGAITLQISQGQQLRPIPDVTGQNETDAATSLTENGFTLAEKTTTRFDENIETGVVLDVLHDDEPIDYTAAEPVTLETDTELELVVSAGPAPREIPKVVGLSETAAKAAITNAGLTPKTSYAFSTRVNKGVVITSNPTAGKTAPRGSTIELQISKGVEMVTIPNVTGLGVEAAARKLRSVGLIDRTDGGSAARPVKGTKPAAGTSVAKGSTIVLVQ